MTRRRLIVAAALSALVLAACGEEQSVRTRGAGESTATDVASPEPSRPPLSATEWTDLPPSPLGDWDVYHWAWLADGSGLVQAGAASGDAPSATTSAAAYLSFDTLEFTPLPDLPTQDGLGGARGAWIGDDLVLVGQECPAGVGPSFLGASPCPDGNEARRVVATWTRGSDTWEVAALPDWIQSFRNGSPDVAGVYRGRLVLASGDTPAHVGAYDPSTGEWERWADAPVHDPGGVDPSSMSFGGTPAKVCLLGGEVLAYSLGYGGFEADGTPIDATPNRWWRHDGTEFTEIAPLVTGPVGEVRCAPSGLFVLVYQGAGGSQLAHIAPDGSRTGIGAPAPMTFLSAQAQFGDSVLLTGTGGLSAEVRVLVGTPTSLTETSLPDAAVAVVVGDLLIAPWDNWADDRLPRNPAVAAIPTP